MTRKMTTLILAAAYVEKRGVDIMICRYCGNPLDSEETVCGKCGRDQGNRVQMERFDEIQYVKHDTDAETRTTEEQRSDVKEKNREPEWNRFVRAVQDEKRVNRIYRRKSMIFLFFAAVMDLILLILCISLNFRVSGLEQQIQNYNSSGYTEQNRQGEDAEPEIQEGGNGSNEDIILQESQDSLSYIGGEKTFFWK